MRVCEFAHGDPKVKRESENREAVMEMAVLAAFHEEHSRIE